MGKEEYTGAADYVLGIDCETTGLTFGSDDPSIGHQPVSWGLIVVEAATLKTVEELYIEVKWNSHSKKARLTDATFGEDAEKIHGLSFEYLEQNGITENDAVVAIASLILKYWGPTVCVKTLGHNVHMFDLPFLKAQLRRYDVDIRFGNRHYDTNSAGFIALRTFTSNELFSFCGYQSRDNHNALDDARMAVGSARAIRMIADSAIYGDE